ncbi:MAG TPA: 1,6-anhydro-N-acetylmuramyl-L-alanine amidase AmpD [Gammaproteobacteria bacterium]|nr:1,6-anhydro-N-acetylmuramyl-L-alanine amidase AmpD [Gammaproteobacteria bacterium]
MRINPNSHCLDEAVFLESPNQDARPASLIDLLAIHNISLPPGQFGGRYIEDFFCNQLDVDAHAYFEEIADMRVSSHLLVCRDGRVVQFVPFDRRAWHAGESCFEGRERCNDFSIGIEVEGTDELPYAEIQYEVLSRIVHTLMDVYPHITRERIVGHSAIAPTRKTDPGPAFNWSHLHGLLDALDDD